MPPANGRWDKRATPRALRRRRRHRPARRAPARARQITRTTGGESQPALGAQRHRTSRTCATATCSSCRSTAPAALVTQLTDVAPSRPEPRLTDSQKFIRDEEEKLIDFIASRRPRRRRPRRRQKLDKLPAFELQDRQTAVDLMLSPDDTHVFIVVGERGAGAKNTIVPNYVTETGYTEDIPGRTERRRHAGSPAARRPQPEDRQDGLGGRQLRTASARAGRACGPQARPGPSGAPGTHARSARSAGRCPSCPTTASWWSPRAVG